MKKCPKCKAELQENARFCLYCMTSFEEKNAIATPIYSRKWVYIIVAVLLLGALGFGGYFVAKNPSRKTEFSPSSSESSETSSPTNNEFSSLQSTPSGDSSQDENSTSSDETNTPQSPEGNNTPTDTPTSSEPAINPPANGEGKNPTDDLPSNEPTAIQATYLYRAAKYGDDFSATASYDNCVVITGIKTASPNGEYVIPDTIDGKKVIAIMGLAFCDEEFSGGVKKVIVPASVKTIWNYAFANCYNLTDIYFKGNAIYTESKAFAEIGNRNSTLTIHCSANCSDRNFRYYKTNAASYGAEYKEWNG